FGSAHIDQHARDIAEPAPVGRPTVVAHGLAPADHVVAAPGGGVFRLEHDPAMDGEYALPAAGASGEDEEPGLAVCCGLRKHAHARPVGVAEACRAVLAGIKRRMN